MMDIKFNKRRNPTPLVFSVYISLGATRFTSERAVNVVILAALSRKLNF
jgi:Na+/serine symporter